MSNDQKRDELVRELVEALKQITNSFNMCRLIMDKAARDEAGVLVNDARAVLAKAKAIDAGEETKS